MKLLFKFSSLVIYIGLSARFPSDGTVGSDRRFAPSAVLYNVGSEYTHLNFLLMSHIVTDITDVHEYLLLTDASTQYTN